MNCWKCGAELQEPPSGKLSFRAQCDRCSSWLHACRNCRNYKPGLPNDCMIPGTDFIADREASNFCEEFQLLGKAPGKNVDPNSILKRLFGEDTKVDKPEDPFGGLFK